MEGFNVEQKNKIETLALKNTVTKIGNVVEGTEERINEVEDRAIEITQTEER